MSQSKEKVVGVILAGGEGKRLRPLTYYFQKCMIPIGSHQRPLMEYILILLKRHGIVDTKLLVGYKHEQIENYFDHGGRVGVNIAYLIDDPTIGGSGGALLNAASAGAFKDAGVLLVYYGDIVSNIDLTAMLTLHSESKSAATLAVANGFEVPVGVAQVEGNAVKGWVEKPLINIYAGIGVVALHPEVLNDLRELAKGKESVDLMGDLIPYLLKKQKKVGAYVTNAFWYDVGSMEKYEKLDKTLVDKLFEN